jgi:ATP-dependent exoDNAse (exonuclease V) beta subunit
MINFNPPNLQTLIELYDSFSSVRFFDKDHNYEIDGEKAITSVSGLIGRYEKPFDTQKIAERVANKQGVSVKQIIEQWEYNKNYSCHKGSEFHLYVENFLERRFAPLDRQAIINFISGSAGYHKEDLEKYYQEMALFIRNFKNFYDWWKQDHILIKSEFVVGDKRSKVCGTIDNLSFNKKTNEFAIFDYKTNKKINRKNDYGETLLDPYDYIPKCELSKYSLQLWLYKLIIERNSPFQVGELGIVWVAGEDDYELIKPVDYRKEAAQMLESV